MGAARLGFGARQRKLLRENLIAYLFLSPAFLIIFVFGLFPVGFALYVSLFRWRRFPEEFVGLAQYERALGEFAYVAFFWLGALAIGAAVLMALRFVRQVRSEPKLLLAAIPGGAFAATLLLIVAWFVTLLPIALNIPQRLRGQARSADLFIGELVASLQAPEVVAMATAALVAGLIALVLAVITIRVLRTPDVGTHLLHTTSAWLLLGLGLATLWLTVNETIRAIETSIEAGAELPIWTMIIMISAGVAMLVAAYFLWQRAMRHESDRGWVLWLVLAALLMGGGYVLVAELPPALANADRAMLQAYNVTLMYTLGTVPIQILAGLTLAYFLFQKIKLKSFFRVTYFLPYVTPFVATSIVFGILFSHRPSSPVNQLMTALGLPVQKWLLEPTGVFQLIFGPDVPAALAGPSLALVVIIVYTSWTYIGYATVVYLAGLGNISGELYEAARIDGAGEWNVFRHMTLPLLSPTTFFLTLIAIIGTLQSFTQVWILRTPAAAKSVDTVGVVIYTTISATEPNMGYGAALSLVLFVAILLFTLLQNRISSGRVHYG
ncbi:MAG TPA: ABC transporter permease subunit [Candidatus Limnocylindrales bacterium]|nr:ABC transporter permease subunit [Candidatus Limnocylindrales bacterium]